MYSNLLSVLVLGMCFFAGGVKYSEQGFGASEFPLCISCLSHRAEIKKVLLN